MKKQKVKLLPSNFDIKRFGNNRVYRALIGDEKDKEITPQKILSNWVNKFVFKKDEPLLNQKGLRPPQLGALYAIASYFSVKAEYEPITIVLPTGTGKTETMLATLLYHRCEKLLVLVPNNQLREQLLHKFLSLGVLPDIGVIPSDTYRPAVARIISKINSLEEVSEILESSNVIIATPNVLNVMKDDIFSALCSGCTDLFIDEAHHAAADTWTRVKKEFLSKKIIQFTATPFRKDGKPLGGKIIFNYKLGYAQRDKYYQTIRKFSVEEFGDQKESDKKIAQKAVEILKSDIEAKADHILMARVKGKKRAESLLPIYENLAPEFNPVVIYSGRGVVRNNENLDKLFNRTSRIVICVDMLGEGFDFPNLKIAAIHDAHKSLAITLQFIGRFTRQNERDDSIKEAAVVINSADHQVEKSMEGLRAEGADWDKIIKNLSESKIAKEEDLQKVSEELRKNGNLCDQISLENLRPSLVAQIYTTTCTEWTPEKYKEAFSTNAKCWHSLDEKNKLLIRLCQQILCPTNYLNQFSS